MHTQQPGSMNNELELKLKTCDEQRIFYHNRFEQEFADHKKTKEKLKNRWMDMDSAPKDGTEILVYDLEFGVKQCAWLNDANGYKAKPEYRWCVVGSWQDEQGGHYTIDNPIKWMPTPEFKP